jgi:hypothetical protein
MSDEEEEIPGHVLAWQEESWTFHTGTRHEDPLPMFTDYCIFHDGIHYPGRNCPHDEEGNDVGSVPYEPDESDPVFWNRVV